METKKDVDSTLKRYISLGPEHICLNEIKLTLTDLGKYQQC